MTTRGNYVPKQNEPVSRSPEVPAPGQPDQGNQPGSASHAGRHPPLTTMPCYHPVKGYQSKKGARLSFGSRAPFTNITVPCGRCIGCRLEYSRQWAVRCDHERSQHKENSFLTLTYASTPLTTPPKDIEPFSPTGGPVDETEIRGDLTTIAPDARESRAKIARVDSSPPRLLRLLPQSKSQDRSTSCLTPEGGERSGLSLADHQKFIKRLRDKCGPLRYFMCGEYGTKLLRPHYHYIIFGLDFPDKYPWDKSQSGEQQFRSATLEQLWPYGYSTIGAVTFESCAYVARYITKKVTGEQAADHYRRTDEAGNDYWLKPEFCAMSRKPGIAATWFERFHTDVYPHDHVITRGQRAKPPRYYDNKLLTMDPAQLDQLKEARRQKALKQAGDNTPERLKVKETVARARLNLKKRPVEQ